MLTNGQPYGLQLLQETLMFYGVNVWRCEMDMHACLKHRYANQVSQTLVKVLLKDAYACIFYFRALRICRGEH